LLLTAVLLWIWIERLPRLLQTRRAAIERISLARGAHSNKPTARCCIGQMGQTD